MRPLLETIRSHLPRRRRRFWRYVSPGRRGAGAVFLAMVVLLTYGYWYMTNDRRVAAQAQEYLQSLTGGRVKVQRAHFSLLGGITLSGVRLYLPGAEESPEPFFTAASIELKHRPLALLRGRVEPTEILCVRPVLSLERDMRTGDINAQKLMPIMDSAAIATTRPALHFDFDLPLIRFRDCTFRVVRSEMGLRQTQEKHLNMSMIPQGRDGYRIVFEVERGEKQAAIEGSISLNFKTGEVIPSGQLPIEDTIIALPQKYIDWLNRYRIKGLIDFRGRSTGQKDRWDFDLVDASMSLPKGEGGVGLEHVNGGLSVDSQGVTVSHLKGRMTQAGGGFFELSGRYDGFEESSPFRFELVGRDVSIPDWHGLSGGVAEAMKNLDDTVGLSGKADMTVRMARAQDGSVTVEGHASLKAMTVTVRVFPYRLDGVTGEVTFDSQKVELKIAGTHGRTRCRIDGAVLCGEPGWPYELNITGRDVPLDDDMRDALPPSSRKVYESLAPLGETDVDAKVSRGKGQTVDDILVTIRLDGEASVRYAAFPYLLERLQGLVEVHSGEGNRVRIESVTGQRGDMRCRIDGSMADVGTERESMDLSVSAVQVPLDSTLAQALGERGREMFLAAGRPVAPATQPATSPGSGPLAGSASVPAEWPGLARRVRATLAKRPGAELDYTVKADIADAAIAPREFPYRLDSTSGFLTITPRSVELEEVRGLHGQTAVMAKGRVLLGQPELGIDLQMEARSIALDRAFHDALPVGVQRVWERLKPAGQADVKLLLQANLPQKKELYYLAEIQARGMEVTYADFPHTFRNVTGLAVATPGRVELRDMTSASGDVRVLVKGAIVSDAHADAADLSVRADHFPIEPPLLRALPGELAELSGRFKPGGWCSVDLSRLSFVRRSTPPTSPANGSPPAATWIAEGSFYCKDAVLDIGQDAKMFTGKLSGRANRSEAGLELNADAAMDSVKVGPQQVTNLHCRVTKSAKSPLVHVGDMAAEACGGLLAGMADIRLVEPLEYGIRLEVEGVDLGQLVNAGVTDPAKRFDVKGKLAGMVRYSSRPGSRPAQQASGTLRITQAKFGKLPVMLDLLHVLFLALPGESGFTEGDLVYHLKDDRLVLEEIFLTGPSAALVGSGTMNVKNEKINLTFLSSTPGKLPRIRLLSELLDGISRELTEVRVTGTISKPKMNTVAFRSLQEIVGVIQNPGGSEKD